jgi:DNA invertase Pin-like site-specific DNA recombinase
MDRPKLRALIERVQQGEIAGIVVARLDRFARNLSGGLEAIEEVHTAGGFVVSVDGGVDTSEERGSMGQLQLGLLLLLAEWERTTRAEGFEASKDRAVERGVHISAFAPYGYVRPEEKGSRLEPDPVRRRAVLAAFKLRASGGSLADVVDMLNTRAPGGPRGVGVWTSATVARMLRNPVYTGQARQGKHAREDAHPAIVPADLFREVQNLRPQADRRAKPTSLLAGLCRCAGCSFAIARTRSRGVEVLRCRRHYALGDCTEPVEAAAHLVEPVVVARFFEALAPGGILARPADEEAELDALRAALEAAERELSEYISAVSVSELGAALYRQGLEPRQKAVEQARDALEAAATTAPGLPDLVDIQDEWENLTIAERRELLSAGLDAVFVARDDGRPVADRVTLVWKGHRPDLVAALPRRGRVTEPHPLAA